VRWEVDDGRQAPIQDPWDSVEARHEVCACSKSRCCGAVQRKVRACSKSRESVEARLKVCACSKVRGCGAVRHEVCVRDCRGRGAVQCEVRAYV